MSGKGQTFPGDSCLFASVEFLDNQVLLSWKIILINS